MIYCIIAVLWLLCSMGIATLDRESHDTPLDRAIAIGCILAGPCTVVVLVCIAIAALVITKGGRS